MAKKKIDETELKALVAAEISDAELYSDSDISVDRVKAMNYYRGVMDDTPSAEGWSSFMSRDVADVIGWVLPGIIRVFTAADRMVDYEPRRPGDENFTDQASDYANYIFWVDNDGYRLLWDATHDSLLLADGIVKTWWDDAEEYETTFHTNQTEEGVAMLLEEEGTELLEHAEGQPQEEQIEGEPVMGPDGQMMPGEPQIIQIPTYDVKIRRLCANGKIKIKAIEPENFLIDRESITIEDARFTAHRDPHMTRSRLVEMGFDREIVESIPRYNGASLSQSGEESARGQDYWASLTGDKSYDRIEYYECYLKKDVNGDGIAETILAHYAGAAGNGVLLDWEEYDDEQPFDQIPCEPVPHRFASRSLAGDVMDIQRVKTVLLRQMLDNTYQVNNPQKDVEENSIVNMDELVNPTIGGTLIRTTGSAPVNYNVVPSILPNALQALESMDRITEMRTGVSRATMALDPEALQNQTATASNNQKDSAYSQIELIARNQAELGWKKVFGKILRLIVKHQDRPRTIRLRDEWVDMDPRSWNAGMDAIINVGLGTGSRDRDLQMLAQINAQQKEMMMMAQSSGQADIAFDMIPMIIKTAVKMAEAAGIRNAADYFPDVSEEQIQQMKQAAAEQAGKPDPKTQAELDAKMMEMQGKLQIETQKMQAEFQLKNQQLQMEMALKEREMAMEYELKRETSMIDAMNRTRQTNANITSKVQMGGQLG